MWGAGAPHPLIDANMVGLGDGVWLGGWGMGRGGWGVGDTLRKAPERAERMGLHFLSYVF